MRDSVPSRPAAIVSCHLEQPLDDEAWRRFDELQRSRPGGFDVIALMRPPDAAFGEDEERWLSACARRRGARAVRPAHALDEPDPRAPDRRRSRPRAFGAKPSGCARRASSRASSAAAAGTRTTPCRRRCASSGSSTARVASGAPRDGVLPTTHSLGQLARAVARAATAVRACVLPRLRPARPEAAARARGVALTLLARRRPAADALALAR